MRYPAAGALGALFSCLLAAGIPAAAAEEARPASTLSLEIVLTIAPDLPAAARASLLDEVTRIWGSEGVTINWRPDSAAPAATNPSLRVLVVARRDPAAHRGDDGQAVGELLGRGHAVAIVSIEAAERLVEEALPSGFRVMTVLGHQRLGLVLGRAVAHEIGHYLLDTHTHARHGLMRRSFDAREFSALRSSSFTLDPNAAQWLKDRFLPTGQLQIAQPVSFSYAR